MSRRIAYFVALGLLLAACTQETAPTTTADVETTVPEDPGRLVILDETGNVAALDPDGSNRIAITEDAGPNSAVYTQPVWSPDATKLAWGQATGDGFAVAIRDAPSGETTTIPTDNLPFYTSWSPDSSSIGALHNGTTGVVFLMIDVESGSSEALDEDAPFYFTWSPEGDMVVTHAGADRVESLGVDGARESLTPTGPDYLAPQWTDRGVLHVTDGQLVLDQDTERTVVAEVAGFTNFVANGAGSLIALQSTEGGGAIEVVLGAAPTVTVPDLVVLDVDSGEVASVSPDRAGGFFWSPDGASLLVFQIGEGEMVPLVWTREGTTDFAGYRPTGTMIRDTFPFFPQYAQSVRFWSPDSTRFAYAGEIDGEAGVWVQSVDAEAPQVVADGVWVAWSGPAG
jgi:TolB protein